MGMAQGVRTPLAERSDDQLGALVAQGDEQAFAELYQRYFRGLYDFTLRTLRDRDATTDVVQTTFVKAWTALRSPKGVENVKAWLYAVARNLAIDELRRRQRIAPKSGEGEEDPIYTIVEVRRVALTKMHTIPVYLVGCRFVKRVTAPTDADYPAAVMA